MKHLVLVVALCACGSSSATPDAPPTCEASVANFYSAGCQFVDSAGNHLTEAKATATCDQLVYLKPNDAACATAVTNWIACMGAEKRPGTCSDCDTSLAAVQSCM